LKLIRPFLSLAFLVLSVTYCSAQKEDWLPVTQQDHDVKEVPNNPGADAIQLYYADYIDDQEGYEFLYQRIKVLNEKGKSHADVEIVLPPDGELTSLKARTIHPDGKIVEFTGKPFQKTVIKGRGIKILAKSFTMPDVTVGSIIEYKYRVGVESTIRIDNFWTIQHDLYTVKENFRMTPYTGALRGFEGGYRVTAIYSHMPDNIKPVQNVGGYQLEVSNMPAFEAEGYMPPEEDFKPQMRFFYVDIRVTEPNKFWQDAGREWNNEAEHFIGNNHKEIAQAAVEAIGDATTPEQKLRRLYLRAQQIRSLAYERERTAQEEKKENLKANQSVVDVLTRGTGYSNAINRFFVAMARSAGFDVSIVRAGDRKERFFDKGLLSKDQLPYEIAVVNVAGKDVYLDPATRFCTYGEIRWIRTSTMGLKLDKKGGSFITVPSATYEQAMTKRYANMTLSRDGTLKGTVTLRFEEGEALEHRLDALETDEAGRTKSLEDELQTWLPSGAVIKLTESQGWDAALEPLVATFNVEVPGYASVVGKRMVLPAYMFQVKQMDAFSHADRKFPVYFAYAFGETDRVNITLPDGFRLESVPQQQTAHLGYAAYQNLAQFDGARLVTQRVLQMNGIFISLDKYKEVKDFFSKVQAGDEEQAVLTGGSTNAQKGN
jgi:hypothetical protein